MNILGGFFFLRMYDQIVGSKNSFFFSRRQGAAFDGFSKETNTLRGVVSGILRKIRAIDDRIFLGTPTDRNGVYRDRRAASFMVMVLGAVFKDEQSIHNTIKDFRPVAKGMQVASAIWIDEIKRRSREGLDLKIDDMYEAHYAEGLRQIRLITDESVNDFETVLICAQTILGGLSRDFDRAQWTPEDEDKVARGLAWPCYLQNADALEAPTFRKPKHTNHVYDSIESLIYSVKGIIKATIKEKAYKYGWKTCKRVMAMCLQSLEKQTLAGLMNAQRYLKNFLVGKTNFGKRKAVGKAPKVIMSDNEVNLLHGAVRAKQDFLGMPFDLAIFRIKTS